VAGGPLAWAISYAVNAALLSPSCTPPGPTFLGMSEAQIVELVVAAAAALVAAGAGIVSWRVFRQVSRPEEETVSGSISPASCWSLGGMFLSVVFLFAIAATAAASATVNGICSPA
jgi:hypothetical protein